MRAWAILLTILCSAVAAAQSDAGMTVKQQLAQRVAHVQFDQVPLREALDELATLSGTQIVVQWGRLDELAIEPDHPVSVRARNLRLDQILWLMMNDIVGGDAKLAYRADGDVILISTAEHLEQELFIRVYNVQDLLVTRLRRPSFSSSRVHQIPTGNTVNVAGGAVAVQPVIEEVRSGATFEGEDSSGNVTTDRDGNVTSTDPTDRLMQRLIEVITSTVEPDSWDTNGGRGSITRWRNMLVVRNSALVHQRIGGPIGAPAVR